ncbi:MAG: cytochrome c3 family protein [Coriobacteriia bacterium]
MPRRTRDARLDTCAPLLAALVLACALAVPGPATGLTAPHVTDQPETAVCAMCHRGHSAPAQTRYRSLDSSALVGSALIIADPSTPGDSALCFACHGTEALGSGTDVGTAFGSTSTHSLAPTESAFGPVQKQCSSCHDSHGTARTASGTPYPALLRAYNASNAQVFSGDALCATCHEARPVSLWAGIGVWGTTAHARDVPAPVSGTGIVCSTCHDPHGSPAAPLIVGALYPPAAPATVSVTANDRTFCLVCHMAASETYPSGPAYAGSAHALSTKTASIGAEYASAESSRAVGECQSCHDPMGSSDGSGSALPKIVSREGRKLCDGCHDSDGPASADVSATGYPSGAAGWLEVAAGWAPATATASFGRVAVYAQAATSVPRPLVGPREYAAGGRAGALAAGDLDDDGSVDLVAGDPGVAQLSVLSPDPLKGLSIASGPGVLAIPAGFAADYLAVTDVFPDASGRPEIIVANRVAGKLWIYRYSGAHQGGVLATAVGPISVGTGVSGLAVGDVTGSGAGDIAVTAETGAELRILSESMSVSGAIDVHGPYGTGGGPRGPAIGDAYPGGRDEVVLVAQDEPTDILEVHAGDGSLLASSALTNPGGAIPYAALVADVLPGVTRSGTSGDEVVVVMSDQSGSSAVNVLPQRVGGGFDAGDRLYYATGTGSGSLAAGDLDGDGDAELVVGDAGYQPTAVPPSLRVLHANGGGTALDPSGVTVLWGGGVEIAGTPPALTVADFGAVGPSRHPVGGVPRAHVSTEVALFERHVECVDCHDPHLATSTVAAAPAVPGALSGAWGVAVTNDGVGSLVTYVETRGVAAEYELCLKCHSPWARLDGARDIASELNTRNASVHAVEPTATGSEALEGSFEASWTNGSTLYCGDCHGATDDSLVRGSHASTAGPLLRGAYLGVRSSNPAGLCFRCHKADVYASTFAGSLSRFYDGDLLHPALHAFHSGETGSQMGFGCEVCHVSHGSQTLPHLLRPDSGFTHGANGGSCLNACHDGTSKTYTRP